MGALMTHALTVAAALAGVAVAALLFALLWPDSNTVRADRRRPRVEQRSAASGVAEFATRRVEALLEKRNVTLAERFDMAGVGMPPSQAIVLAGCAMVVGFAVGLVMGLPALGVLFALFVPVAGYFWLSHKTTKRRADFAQQLDETAQMMAGSLRSGYSFTQAMATVGREAASPTAEEFGRMTNELRVGRSIGSVMDDTAERMQSEDFSWISQAVAINREVGGNLADVLEGVAHTIRERAALKRQVKSLAAEGKLSGYVLIGLPFFIVGALSLLNPSYMSVLFERKLGWAMIAVACVMLIVGALWMRKTVEIKF